MSHSYFHRRRCKLWKAPKWFVSACCTKPERRVMREVGKQITQGLDLEIDWPDGRRFKWRWSY